MPSQVTFHFQTKLCDEKKTLIDDSRKWNKPMQLILGRKFKLPVWEVLVKNMALNEVAQFTVDKSVSNNVFPMSYCTVECLLDIAFTWVSY